MSRRSCSTGEYAKKLRAIAERTDGTKSGRQWIEEPVSDPSIEATGFLDRSIGVSSEKAPIVLSHLTDNAIYHNAKRVRLEAIEDNGSIKMMVSNDGDPISEPNREKIFDAFFTTRRDTGGTGMGVIDRPRHHD